MQDQLAQITSHRLLLCPDGCPRGSGIANSEQIARLQMPAALDPTPPQRPAAICDFDINREREGPRRDFSGGPGVVLCGLSARQPQQQSEFARRAFSSYLNYLARRPGDWLRIRNERFGMSRACASPVICKFTWPRECILHGASGRTNFRMIAWAHRRRGRRADAYNGSIYFPELDGPIGYYMLVSVTCIASYSTIQPPTLQWK